MSQRNQIEAAILEALAGGPQATTELAATTGEDSQAIYRRCRRLAERGMVRSAGKIRHPLTFCIECQVAVTRDNYAEHEDHELRRSGYEVCVWELTALPSPSPSSSGIVE
ncbi:MAG TPA: helix-turn-helix domain-containing protein [Thermoanaerobaculia bacterium]|nr:helix-turn-helix domain-containing protein [Thermoanaerobaculia bacterium]